MEDFSDFQRGQIVGARLAGASVIKTASLLCVPRAAVSKVMMAYTHHGRTSSAKRTVSIYHRSNAAKVAAEHNIHLEDHFHKNSLMRASQIHHPW